MMKNYILLLLALLSFTFNVKSQVTIGSAIAPDKNALLDLKEQADGSSTKGFLLPRVSLVSTIDPSPMTEFVEGMIVYNIATADDETNSVEPGFYICDGYKWIELESITEVEFPSEPWRVSGTSAQATQNTQNIYQNAQVTIGRTGKVDATAQLDISSSNRGLLVPRLTEGQRNAIKSPTESLLIWNKDIGCFNFRYNEKWRVLCGGLEDSAASITIGDCTSTKVIGSYKVGKIVTTDNYLELTVQVLRPGSFNIEVDTEKGFFFQKNGSFPSIGTYTIQLPVIGTPNTAGTFNIPIRINDEDTTCSVSILVENPSVEFEFLCSSAVADDLKKGQSANGETMTINVNVITAGVFNFYSNTVSGVQYTANNLTLSAGVNQVKLHASGTPTVSGTKAFTLTGTGIKGSSCEVDVVIQINDADLTLNCGSATVNGVYKIDEETTLSNFIDIPVNFVTDGVWTATSNVVAGISFSGSGMVSSTGSKVIRLDASGTPTTAGKQTFTLTVNDQTCNIDVNIVFPKKNILLIGDPSASISTALSNSSNFGEEGTSKVESLTIISGPTRPTAAQLVTLINTNKIDIIISGWRYNSAVDAVAVVIADFIKNKKGYFFWAQSQGTQTLMKPVLDKAYTGTSITMTADRFGSLYSVILPNTDHPILNGVFGDVRNKYIRSDDDLSWMGSTPESTMGVLKSFVELPANGSYVARNTYLYAPGFFMYPDWGSLNYTNTQYGSNSPIAPNTASYTSTLSWDGTQYLRQTIPVGDIVNWILFGNVMDYAFKYVQENIDSDYQVTE